ncbi:DUF167 domain-containing protein [Nanoarchaeota archaeon]
MNLPNSFKLIVKTNQRKTEITFYDDSKKAFLMNVKEKPENNKANIAIISYLKKVTKKDYKIVKGKKSKEKVISLV